MDDISKIWHHAIENNPTVYDEEALTVLQLVARLTAKSNEVVDRVNKIPEDAEKAVQQHITSGEFDEQIYEYNKDVLSRAAALEARLNSILAGSAEETLPEIADMRVGIDNTQHSNAGSALREQIRQIVDIINYPDYTVAKIHEWVHGEYYSNTNGAYGKSTEFMRSPRVYPCPGKQIIVTPDTNGETVILTCYDRNYAYLGSIKAVNSRGTACEVRCTPAECAYIGVTVYSGSVPEGITLRRLRPFTGNCIEYPFEMQDIEYVVYRDHWAHSNGYPTANTNYYSVYMLAEGIEKVYVHAQIQTNAVWYNSNFGVICHSKPNPNSATTAAANLYDAPKAPTYNDVAVLAININALQLNEQNNPSNYIIPYHRGMPLYGETCWCIGDSITYIDNTHQTGAKCTPVVGYQKWLRKLGLIVTSTGYSGRPLATPTPEITGISDAIKNGEAWVSADHTVIFAGSNDVRLGVEVGENVVNGDDGNATMSNALHTLAKFIIQQHPTTRVYFCSIIRGTAVSFSQQRDYNNALEGICRVRSIHWIDLNGECPFNAYSSDVLTYDGTHPTTAGAERIGKVIGSHILLSTGGSIDKHK